MRKYIFLCLTLTLLYTVNLFGQGVLSNYNGFWTRFSQSYITFAEIMEFYPDKLDILRNEIYARYGRPFLQEKYKQYFSAQNWYVEKPYFSISWLNHWDHYNADFILEFEKDAIFYYNVISDAKKNNIVYRGNYDVGTIASLYDLDFSKFTTQTSAVGSWFPDYYIWHQGNWIVCGNWLIIDWSTVGRRYDEDWNVFLILFRLNTETREITGMRSAKMSRNKWQQFLISQEKIKLSCIKDW
jgi:hypothetical protein